MESQKQRYKRSWQENTGFNQIEALDFTLYNAII